MNAPPPEYGVEFLRWFREATERAWAPSGADWTGGLTDDEIDEVERRWAIRFAPDHRLFLRVVHARTSVGGPYHWLRDEYKIGQAFEWLVEGLVFDVEENGLWPASWGARPDDEAVRAAHVAALVAAAPPLLPFGGHRYVLADGPTIVLSVYQSDIIVYGNSMRSYLLNEYGELLGIEGERARWEVDVSGIPFWGELLILNGYLA